MLAIGSSTGGPQALFTLIQALGRSVNVPVILTQHMPATFTPILAEHITRLGGLPCAEAKDGEPLLPGRIYLAPGDKHLIVEAGAGQAGHRTAGFAPWAARARAAVQRPAGEFLPARGRSDAALGRCRLRRTRPGRDADRDGPRRARRHAPWWWKPAARRSRRMRRRAWCGACRARSLRRDCATRCCRCRGSRRSCSKCYACRRR